MRSVRVAVARPLYQTYTYRVPPHLDAYVAPGSWVRVPLGRSQSFGYVLGDQASDLVLKDILEAGLGALSQEQLALCQWVADYTLAPLGEVLAVAAPAESLKLRRSKFTYAPTNPSVPELNVQQKEAADLLWSGSLVGVLEGVTGSGKTEVYAELARRTLSEGRSSLFLVPQIALTPALESRIARLVPVPVLLWHSGLSPSKRFAMSQALKNHSPVVLLGARSAVFAPIRDLGLIIVDEEHDPTYKQEDHVRYHARDVALVRGRMAKARVILGSATLSLETKEKCAKYQHAVLKTRFSGGVLPTVRLVPASKNLSHEAVLALRATLARGEQSIIFLNKRGYASCIRCTSCKYVCMCPACSLSLTAHKGGRLMRCHVCGYQAPSLDMCPKCDGILQCFGFGTEKLDLFIRDVLPTARVLTLDRDHATTVKKLTAITDAFAAHEADILIGTQMVVSGHDFANVTLVIVVSADALFYWPDFRASERALQILTQVAGRAGRRGAGEVLIQAEDYHHPVLEALFDERKRDVFFKQERGLRQALLYPPFGRIIRCRIEARTYQEARDDAEKILRCLQSVAKEATILGPSEAFLEKKQNTHRFDILLRGQKLEHVHGPALIARTYAQEQKIALLIDVDPYGL